MNKEFNQVSNSSGNNSLCILLIIFAVILAGLFVLILIKQKNNKKTNHDPNITPTISAPSIPPEKVESVTEVKDGSWKNYKNDVIGIKFQYQEAWGEPSTNYLEHITRLSSLEEDFKAQKIHYENMFDIIFENNDRMRIRIFNEQYSGKSQSGIDEPSEYVESGATGNVVNLKNNGNICNYNIGYNYGSNALKTIYSDCEDGVKTVLTQNKQFFDFGGYGTLYSYDLRLLSFKKLQNGYFDNVLVSYRIGSVSQIKDDSLDLSGFLKSTGLENNYEINKKIFTVFVQSFSSFVPPAPAPKVFEIKNGENPDITAIRRYYFYLETGKLEDAYKMSLSVKTNHDQFKEWYGNVYSAKASQFTETAPHQYRFFVDYQDNNDSPEKYRVEMKVDGGKFIPVSSEKLLSEIIVFGNMAAFSKQINARNYMVFSRDGIENIIDQADDFRDNMPSIASLGVFLDPQFSPNGNYLTYRVVGYEWSTTKIYDIKNKIVKPEYFSAYSHGFTDNEKYFYDCEANAFAGELYGRVFGLPAFGLKYDLSFEKNENAASIGLNCEYDEYQKVIRFIIANSEESKNRVIEYSVISNKVEVK